MNVNFNNLRAQAAYRLDDLTKKLNAGLMKQRAFEFVTDENGKEKEFEGDLLITAEDIQKDMDDLRMLIMTIGLRLTQVLNLSLSNTHNI